MVCKHCGSNEFSLKNGNVVCDYCGCLADNDELEKWIYASRLANIFLDDDYVPQEDIDKFTKLSKIPLRDISNDDLLWCYAQDKQNTSFSKKVWREEIERRKLKVKLL